MVLKTSFICPFCFEEHKIPEVQFRCGNKRCKDVDDIEMTKYENGDINAPKKGKPTFNAEVKKFRIPKSENCPECGSESHKIICPSCHNNLPESTLLGKDMIISIVGSRDTGKSHFVGVIINELIERIAVKFGGAMEGFDDTNERYRSGFYQKLFVDMQKLDLTKSSTEDINNDAYRPLIFTLKLKRKVLFMETIENFTLVFFDTAGEDLNDEDTMSTVNKYICKSSGIIFLLDPLQFPQARHQLDDEVVERASSVNWQQATGSGDIMTRVSKLIRNDRNMKTSKKIDIPVAAVFSKFDAIEPLIPKGSMILENSPHCDQQAFDLSDKHNIDSEIKGLLSEWGAQSFMGQIDVNYSNYSYFGVSSLGLNNNPSKDSGRIEKPRPHRIEDPLLWILNENKVIKSSK
ncbi:MAG: hypothetical protein ACTHW2_01075 [Tissierella sp.]|uniref:hypothetical protein n=1 Tax=Tissierella sp. TaxID=41274 RepID=UPI003F973FEF